MNNYREQIDKYINTIQNIDSNTASEHTYRTPLENLLRNIQFEGLDIMPVHEGKSQSRNIDGTPDFIIYKDDKTFFKSLVGFIECKKFDYDLEKVKNSAQIDKYSKTSENILITNYREFILLNKGKEVNKVILLDINFAKLKDGNIYQQFTDLLRDFYNYEYQYIKDKKTLAKVLAAQSFYYSVALRQYIEDESQKEKYYYKKFYELFSDFQSSIQYYYVLEDFCDIYSQSLVYGLFLARLETDRPLEEDRISYLADIPHHFVLLYEFLSAGYSDRFIPTHIRQALVSIGKNINYIHIPSIQKEFKNETHNKYDISVYLYEDFLKEFDVYRQTEKRKESGVYYTPKEVTEFITSAVNDLIISDFNLPQGFMSENVKFLDFACGTGTFIQSIFDIIFNTIYSKELDDLDKKKIKRKILTDIYGFELLFTPYIVAHIILSNYFKSKEINFDKDDRFKIYLTNTLDIEQHSISAHLPQMQIEHDEAHKIKDVENILAIVGNPPYFNGRSQSITGKIEKEIKEYKTDLNEQKINLDDMYIKFIRFAEWKMEKAGMGIVGIITNNGFLDGINFRQMRKHLYETFDEIYILNLHGNSRRGETDKNIFDIMVGVCICIFVKHKEPKNKTTVKYFSTLNNKILRRSEKLEFLKKKKLKDVKWLTLHPEESEYYWFVNKNFKYFREYKKFWKITDIFEMYNSGIDTFCDAFTIHYSQKSLELLKKNIANKTEKEISEEYKVKNSHEWKIENAKSDLINAYNLNKISYRPLDIRYTSLSTLSKGFLAYPRYEIMKHFDNKRNLGLLFKRQINSSRFKAVFITDIITERTILESSYGGSYIAPLYLYNGCNGNGEDELHKEKPKRTNFTKEFNKEYIEKLNFKPTPEKILAYIYAVMHSSIYREKYIEFLKTDFPSVPMTQNESVFEQFAKLGQQLIDLHLLKNIPTDKEIKVNGELSKPCKIIKIVPPTEIESVLKLVTVDKNFISFENVTVEIYNFEIGSYKPLDKWLKYRIKDAIELELKDFEHIRNILITLKYTISIMQKIELLDEIYFSAEL